MTRTPSSLSFVHLVFHEAIGRCRAVILAALALALVFPSLAAGQTYHLNMVSVGINRYRTPGMDLTCVVADARDVADVLRKNPLFGRKDITLLTDDRATTRNMQEAVALLARRATANTYTVLYLSGHGGRDAGGYFLFCGHDYDPRSPGTTSLTGDFMQSRLKNLPGKTIIIIDACHAGSAGLFKTPGNSGQMVLFCSSKADQTSAELPSKGNSAFTIAFLEALGGAADANRDGILNIQEIHNYAHARTAALTGGKQHAVTILPPPASAKIPLALVPGAVPPGLNPAPKASRVWQGKENLMGYGALTFTFEDGGRVTMVDARATMVGTWNAKGDTVTLRFDSGRIVYNGRMTGVSFTGTASNGTARWGFAVTRK